MKPESPIRLRGVKQNNLRNLDLEIPRRRLTVITGLSGSGKSTLAFETLYAEGQRRYVESLSTYTRQFLEKMPKPVLDSIENIPPAIALEQRNTVLNSRSTVGTQTEMLDFLRLFFTKAGSLICKACGAKVIDITPTQLSKALWERGQGKKFALCSPLELSSDGKDKTRNFVENYFAILAEQGFRRVFWTRSGRWHLLEDPVPEGLTRESLTEGEIHLLMDRFDLTSTPVDPDTRTRFDDSFEQALKFGSQKLSVVDLETLEARIHQTGFACFDCGARYTRPSPNLFSFNSPLGACTTCNGFGFTLEVDEKKVVPDPKLALDEGALDPLAKPSSESEFKTFLRRCQKEGIRTGQSWAGLTAPQKKWVWARVLEFFKDLEDYRYKFHVRIFIRRYQTPVECTTCHGSRLKSEALDIRVRGNNLADLLKLSLKDLHAWFESLEYTPAERELMKDLHPQIIRRLGFLCRIGVPYLTLNRLTRSLSGGEFQRINLATHLGNGLCGTLYVLDEPTIGLHPVDTEKLLEILRELRDQGNTLVVVEHETRILEDADWIIELGPEAGRKGGELVAMGTPDTVARSSKARTARFLAPEGMRPVRRHPLRTGKTPEIRITGCREHNLKNLDVTIPLQRLVVVTGVSGSGKTTLIHQTLAPALVQRVESGNTDGDVEDSEETLPAGSGVFDQLTGAEHLDHVILLDQKPIGKNSRSNPATYLKAWDEIRKILASQAVALSRGYTAGYFSFNVDGGRCPTCKGEGEIAIDMHFMAEVKLQCEDCGGKRFIKPLMDVKFKGRSVADLLGSTIDEAYELFFEYPELRKKLQALKDVGLGYLELGQPGPTLSGGEAQRLKIALTLCEEGGRPTRDLFILDEPTTGLHQDDVQHLLEVLHHLVDRGKSVILIEHHLDVIANSDHVIDLGPEGGEAGGVLIAEGTPEALTRHPRSKTGLALRDSGASGTG
jgi:excinuclease ABC subunit A